MLTVSRLKNAPDTVCVCVCLCVCVCVCECTVCVCVCVCENAHGRGTQEHTYQSQGTRAAAGAMPDVYSDLLTYCMHQAFAVSPAFVLLRLT